MNFYIHQDLLDNNEVQEQLKSSIETNREYVISNVRVNNSLDVYMRILNSKTKFFYDEYSTSHNSIILESIINYHQINCAEGPTCFCNRGNNVETDGKIFLGSEYRKEHIYHYSQKMFNTYIQENWRKVDLIHICYFAYLIEVLQNQTLSLAEIIKAKMNKNIILSLRCQQALQYLIYYANNVFKLSEVSHSNKHMKSNQLLKGISLYDVCLFDEVYNQILAEFKVCLNIKFQLLNLLGKDHVNLEQLQTIAQKLINNQYKLRKELYFLIQQFPYKNVEISTLFEFYQQTLSEDESLQNQIQRGNVNRDFMVNQFQILQDKDSCVIFISLLSNFGDIIKVSKNFQDVIQQVLSNSNAIGKNINILLPKQLQVIHTNILQDFTRRKKVQNSLKCFPLQIGCDSKGWAVPFQVKLQLHQIMNKELGVCSWIKRIKNDSSYASFRIDTESKNCQIICISEIIFTTFLQDTLSSNQIEGYSFNLISPTLYNYLLEDSLKQTTIETIFIKPKSIHQLKENTMNYHSNPQYFVDILDNQIYHVKLQFNRYISKYINLAQVEISSFKLISSQEEKVHYLSLLCHQFDQFEINKPISSYKQLQQKIFGKDYDPQSISQLYNSSRSENSNENQEKQNNTSNSTENNNQEVQDEDSDNVFSPSNRNRKSKKKTINISIEKKKLIMSPPKPRRSRVGVNDLRIPLHLIGQNDQQVAEVRNQNFSGINDLISFNSRQQLTSMNNIDQNLLGLTSYTDFTKQNNYNNESTYDIIAFNQPTQRELLTQIKSPTHTHLLSNPQDFLPQNTQDQQIVKEQVKQGATQSSKIQLSSLAQYFSAGESSFQQNNKIMRNRDKQTKNVQEGNQNERDSSINSGKTSSSQQRYFIFKNKKNILFIKYLTTNLLLINRKDMIKQIKSSKKLIGLIVINIMGVASILGILLITLINYFSLKEFLNVQKTSFLSLNWSADIRTSMSTVFSNYYLQSLIYLDVFEFSAEGQKQNLFDKTLKISLDQLDQFRYFIRDFSNGDKDKVFIYKRVLEENIDYLFPFKNYTIVIKTKLPQGLMMQFSNLQTLRDPLNMDYSNMVTAHLNFNMLEDKLQNLQTEVFSNYGRFLHDILNNSKIELITILSVTLFFSIGLIPIYMFVQFRKEDLLKLMTTISPDKIKGMIANVRKYLFKLDQITFQIRKDVNENVSKQESNYFAKQPTINFIQNIEKRKNLSSTSKLNKIDLRFLAVSLIFLSILQIYTVATYATLKYFEKNSIDNQNFMNDVSELRHFVQLQIGSNYLSIVAKIYPEIFVINPQEYLDLSKSLNKKSSSMLTKLYKFEEKFNQYQRFNSQQFEKFLIPILQQKACDTIKNYPLYQDDKMNFNYEDCKSIQNQIFQKGLISSMKLYFTIQNQLIEIFDISEFDEVVQSLKKFQETTTLLDLYQQTDYNCKLIDYIMNFMRVQNLELFSYMENVHFVLIIIQFFSIFISLYFGWFKFYIILEKQLIETKHLLGVIDIHILLENSYIISYFKKSQR